MVETITAKEIGETFVAFVTDLFMIPEGCSKPEVDAELVALEDSGELQQAREDSRADIDALIDRILSCTAEQRAELFLKTDPRTLALVYDRVQCGTHIMIGMAQKGVAVSKKDMPPLPEFFRKMLVQKLS